MPTEEATDTNTQGEQCEKDQESGCLGMLGGLVLLIVGLAIAIPPILNIVSKGSAILTAPFEIESQQISAILPGIEWYQLDESSSGVWKDGLAYVDVRHNPDGSLDEIRIEIKHRNEQQVASAFSAISRIADYANINAERESRSKSIYDWLADSYGGYAPVSPRTFGAVQITVDRWSTDATIVTLRD